MFGFARFIRTLKKPKGGLLVILLQSLLFLFFFLAFCTGSVSPFLGLVSPRPVGTDGLARYDNSVGGGERGRSICSIGVFLFTYLYAQHESRTRDDVFVYVTRTSEETTFLRFSGEAEVGALPHLAT
ncbi:hypothetical protein LX32DRAFT_379877 [Colletotrichum zoysiae]|uniref:Uncharacterized protein n=1 Tax=Colletotrichum zoysiae TaxID=1216348 RepID=A0AAD9HIW7_9PEZI|nr:hypothetical protein LX32DRAFT_379877 [Colletotrichum zoysiae]